MTWAQNQELLDSRPAFGRFPSLILMRELLPGFLLSGG